MSYARRLLESYNYPDVVDRAYHADGSLKSGMYKGIPVSVSHKDDKDAPRTHTLLSGKKPILIHINSKQAINPKFSWYHEIAHIEQPGGLSDDPVEAEFVADSHAIKKTGMDREKYKEWLLKSDRSGDSPAHVKARLNLCNHFAKHFWGDIARAGRVLNESKSYARTIIENYNIKVNA